MEPPPALEIGPPGIEKRAARAYMGIRAQLHFEGMFARVTLMLKELRGWVNSRGIAEHGRSSISCTCATCGARWISASVSLSPPGAV